MHNSDPYRFFFLLLFTPAVLFSQEMTLRGQASGWGSLASSAHSGVRYIPELSALHPLNDELTLSFEGSVNSVAAANAASAMHPSYSASLSLHRAWARVASDRFEVRAGLQKINFGPAMFFRPLMWFDGVDPRDPLQLTGGVYGVLMRYYFPDNANVWLWGLYGNNDRKGLESLPTERNTLEAGGRGQLPLGNGEIGLSFHHRSADPAPLLPALSPLRETRYALDGKWDLEIGLWFELALIERSASVPALRGERLGTIGIDYTFGIGNGVNVAAEHFRMERSSGPLLLAELSALSVSYPLSIMDRVTGMFYHDWQADEWYRLVSAQRTYDNWIVSLLGFWNPAGAAALSGSSTFAGTGAQLMVIYNH